MADFHESWIKSSNQGLKLFDHDQPIVFTSHLIIWQSGRNVFQSKLVSSLICTKATETKYNAKNLDKSDVYSGFGYLELRR